MQKRLFLALFAAALLSGLPARAADNLNSVLARLNTAAQGFRSVSADFKFVSLTTVPIEDTETQTGQVYYDRSGRSFKMAAHIHDVNGQPVAKTYMYADGQAKLWDGPPVDQVTTLTKLSQYESWFALGFGASGTELAEKWNITYDGDEPIDGVTTAKLELVAKDPTVRKNLPKVTVWMDTTRGVSLKQVFDEGQGQSRTATYSNFKSNQRLPSDAFTFKADKKTQYITR
ncbi:MAG: outer membrane lipoprotein-sorting protein [Terracidiphilus sp.]